MLKMFGMTQPSVLEIPYGDPFAYFVAFAKQPYAQLLDSAQIDPEQGRYSFILLNPKHRIRSKNGVCELDGQAATATNPFDLIADVLTDMPTTVPLQDLPPFQGGVAGIFGYDLAPHIENIPQAGLDPVNVPDLAVGIYDLVIGFDHVKQTAHIIAHDRDGVTGQVRAAQLADKLKRSEEPVYNPFTPNWSSPFDQDSYCQTIQRTIDYIRAGDIFQANITQCFQADLPEGFDPFAFYGNLRRVNPALFAAYLNFGDFQIASSSPERFLQVQNKQVETRPIKGTRPRHSDPATDQAEAEALINSPKDRAENTMIVDLLRNDLSRVCKPHSVTVPELCGLHSFASVHHLVSTVTGELQDDKSPLDLLRASFPGGSITGAPKVRAMEIIAELEPSQRGPYCGAIGYIGFDGSMDTNIVIRSLTFAHQQAFAQVGGGIVYDSDPLGEYEETLTKARALFKAFKERA